LYSFVYLGKLKGFISTRSRFGVLVFLAILTSFKGWFG
jgi:hypothetical protein